MKLSANFIELLGNFSTINTGMAFKPGKVLRTMSKDKDILAVAEITEDFEKEFCIYDLNRMLALISLNKTNPEVEVEDESLVFVGLNGKGRIRQRFTSPSFIISPPDKSIPIKNIEMEFVLEQDVFKWIFNVSSILKCPHIVIKGEPGENVTINAVDIKGQIVDSAYVTIDAVANSKFNFVLRNENIKVIPGKYKVKISTGGFALFSHMERNLQYWIAPDPKYTTFG